MGQENQEKIYYADGMHDGREWGERASDDELREVVDVFNHVRQALGRGDISGRANWESLWGRLVVPCWK
jgi:hypothetical protein